LSYTITNYIFQKNLAGGRKKGNIESITMKPFRRQLLPFSLEVYHKLERLGYLVYQDKQFGTDWKKSKRRN
jgi:hypothetical protein